MDMFLYAAQNPSCILAVNADRGGSWWSTLQPPQLRDFSKGYQWNALQDALRALSWTSDYHFTFDFTVADDLENGSYWIMYQSNGRISFALEKDARGCRFVFGSYSFNGGVFVYTPFAPSAAGRHSATLAIIGNTFRITLAGAVYEQTGERAASSGYDRVVTTAAPVTLHEVSLTDDSTGAAAWQAAYSDLYDTSNPWPDAMPDETPGISEAERVRLITKTNVRTDRGAFEAADETQSARVDTALDLRGKVSSYTVVVDFEAAEFPETTTMECHQELAGQGGALIGSGTPPICSIGYYLASSGSARLQLSQEVAGGRHVVNATLTGRLSGRHICCGVVEVDPAAPLTASTLYLDGVRIGNASIYAVPTGNAAVSARCFSIAGHSFTGGWPPYTGKVYSCLLFDRALSAAEIAALTPKQA